MAAVSEREAPGTELPRAPATPTRRARGELRVARVLGVRGERLGLVFFIGAAGRNRLFGRRARRSQCPDFV